MHYYFAIVLLLLIAVPFVVIARRKKAMPLFDFDADMSLSLKGILALLIVLHHSAQPLCNNGEKFFFDFWYWGPAIVGMFFFLAGYGLTRSVMTKEGYMKTFFKKRFLKLLPPYIIAIVVYQCYLASAGRFEWSVLADNFLKGIPPLTNTWYIIAIILFYLLFYAVFKTIRSVKISVVVMWVLSLLYMFAIHKIGWGNWWWKSTLAFNIGMTYVLFESRIKEKIARRPIVFWIIMIVALALLYAFTYADLASPFIEGFPSYSLSFWLLPVFVLFAIYFIGMPTGKVFGFLGKISYELYIVHEVFVWMMPYNGNSFLFLLCIYAVSILIAAGLHKICESFSRKN